MKKEKKISKAMKYAEIAQIFNTLDRYRVFLGEAGERRVLKCDHETRTYKLAKFSVISDEIYMLALQHGDDYALIARDADEVTRCWIKLATPIETPKEIAFKNDPEYAMQRLNFDRETGISLADLPYTRSIIDRMNDVDAFCSFIGSLWYDESHRHQFIWFYGPGRDGKSTLTAALHEIFGGAAVSVNVPESDGSARFWNTHIENKRIAIFDDAENTKFTSSGKFKALTGDKFMMIEHKGQKPYQVRNNCKFLFVSNNEPSLKTDVADFRRMIICKISPPVSPWKEMGAEFEKGVKAEAGGFFNYCLDSYELFCMPDHKEIPVSDEQPAMQQAAADSTESDFQEVLDLNFKVGGSYYVEASILNSVLRRNKVHPKKWREWAAKRHGLRTEKRCKVNDKNCYLGLGYVQGLEAMST
jgi:hypothetical protein